ncbi:MAG: hypothetical protein AAF598_03875 [Bacteroidota bacterium]
MEQKDSLLDVLRSIFKWRKFIIYTCVVVGVLTALLSLALSNYYESSTVFYAANASMRDPRALFSGDPIEYYGGDQERDQILSIINSSEMLDYLIAEFGLHEHYKIDSSGVKAKTKIRKKLRKYFNVKKNERNAIELTMEDKDAVKATQILQGALKYIDDRSVGLFGGSQENMLETLKSDIEVRTNELNILVDSLTMLRNRYGIFNVESMSETLPSLVLETETELAYKRGKLEQLQNSRGVKRDSILYLSAQVQALKSKLSSLTDPNDSTSTFNLVRFSKGVEQVKLLEDLILRKNVSLNGVKERFNQQERAFQSGVSALIMVESPAVPEVKSRPRRSIIVITFGMLAFIFSVIAVLLIEQTKDVDWKSIVNAK